MRSHTGLFIGPLAMFALCMLSACASQSSQPDQLIDPLGPRLADIVSPPEAEPESPPILSSDEIIVRYKEAMKLSNNVQLNQRISMRVTDLELKMIEDQMLDGVDPEFAGLLEGQQLLVKNVEVLGVEPERQQMLHYQLAKAYALDGRVKDSQEVLEQVSELGDHNQDLLTEAVFRQAESAFNRGDFEAAQQGFQQVIDADDNAFKHNAEYMLGWSYLKLAELDSALDAFISILDRYADVEPQLSNLQGTDAAVVDDVMRAMSIIFSYQGGGAGVAAAFTSRGHRAYEAQVYQHVAEYFLSRKRYHDAAQTYTVFVGLYPFSRFSEPYAANTVAIFRRGNFPRLAIEQKQLYLKRYGLSTPYYKGVPATQQQKIKGHLRDYMIDLVSYAHAQAQRLDESMTSEEIAQQFLSVADQYQRFSDTFPEDPQTPQMVYLMADAYMQARAFPEAISAYERAAYSYGESEYSHRAADAAYGAVMMAREALKAYPADSTFWQLRKYDLSIRFSETYASDYRVANVLTDIAIDLLAMNQRDEAIRLADQVVNRQPAPDEETLSTAWRVLSQAQFDLEDYVQAEYALAEALVFLRPHTKAYIETEEKLAASIFQQALLHEEAEELREAAFDLLRIYQFTPGQSLAEKGHFDAINLLIELKDWPQAQQAANSFSQRFPASSFAAGLLSKQLVIYEAQEDWAKAAKILFSMYQSVPDREIKRDSLYLAAQYAEKVEDTDQAIMYYRDFAHGFSEPLSLKLEAQYKLYQLYGRLKGKAYQQRYWLRKMTDSTEAVKGKDDRADYLRSFALMELGDYQRTRFGRIALVAPLAESLQNKSQAMETALRYYRLTMDLGLDEFSTKANYHSAELYRSLSAALLSAPKPKGLDALAAAQYDILLEEQAYPFEEKAIAIHKANIARVRSGLYDQWVESSYDVLADMLPVDFGKKERVLEYVDESY